MALLRDIRERFEAFFLPKTGAEPSAPTRDGMYDPAGDAELITAERRGSLNKDTNGKLYYPTTDGYQRVKTRVESPVTTPGSVTTTDDTAVALTGVDITASDPVIGQCILSAYQNSGGALTLSLYADAGKTQFLFSQAAIPTATPTILTCNTIKFGTVYAAWSAAAGGTQYIMRQRYVAYSFSTV